ncbi:MAG: hypothetical protein H6828_07865 [Planctomycetes bacterium]|nr:hypothetical protein [Planctomycetota bacterium]
MLFQGRCRALYCLDLARRIDLARAETLLAAARRTSFEHKLRAPQGPGLSAPLRVGWSTAAVEVGGHATVAAVEVSLYELGAVCVTWELPFAEATLQSLAELSAALYDHQELVTRSREVAAEVRAALGDALDRPKAAQHVEDYVVFQVGAVEGDPWRLLEESRSELARLLRAENRPLSAQEVEDALARPVAYGRDELLLVDWLAAFLLGSATEDERLLLELATVELQQLHVLDARLLDEIEEANTLLARDHGLFEAFGAQRRELKHVASIQADDALVHEGIDNALKLFGDDYLARVYRTAAARFHFEAWDRSIQRKLEVLHSVYESLADQAAHRRSELLEWIIILLIAVELVLPLLHLT